MEYRIYERVREYIEEYKMLDGVGTVIAGVSGGGDSMAMLDMLDRLSREKGFALRVVHVNHGIRGDEAERDQCLTEQECRRRGIPCKVYWYDVPELSKKWKVGHEEAGRRVRREALERELALVGTDGSRTDGNRSENAGADRSRTDGNQSENAGSDGSWTDDDQLENAGTERYRTRESRSENGEAGDNKEDVAEARSSVRIALAHNQNDLVETMFHHLARGTGIRGLCSMKPVSGNLIRPLLCLERKKIDDYLKERKIPYVTDSTNLEDEYTRNRIRSRILPAMEQEINPRAAVHLAELSALMGEAEEYLDEQGRALADRYRLEAGGWLFTEDFFHQPEILKKYAVMEAVSELLGCRRDLALVHIRAVLELFGLSVGAEASLPGGVIAVRTYTGVRLEKRNLKGKKRILEDETEMPESARKVSEDKIKMPEGYREISEDEMKIPEVGRTILKDKARMPECDRKVSKNEKNTWQDREIRTTEPSEPVPTPDFFYPLPPSGTLHTSQGAFETKIFSYSGQKICEKKYTKWLDYDKIVSDLSVRTRRSGDYLVIDWENSRKKLTRCMIDDKVPRELRDQIPVVASGSEILWIVGGRINERYKITPETGRVLEIKYQGGRSHE